MKLSPSLSSSFWNNWNHCTSLLRFFLGSLLVCLKFCNSTSLVLMVDFLGGASQTIVLLYLFHTYFSCQTDNLTLRVLYFGIQETSWLTDWLHPLPCICMRCYCRHWALRSNSHYDQMFLHTHTNTQWLKRGH